jgi:hypothetical protein
MNKLILIGAYCSLSIFGFSQSIIHNKLTVEFGTSIDAFASADKFMDEFFDNSYNNYRTEPYFERINRQALDLRLNIQYRIARKLSIEIGTATKTYENRFNFIVYNDFTGNYDNTKFNFSLKKQSMSFGLNLFLGNSLAPLGTHIGVFYAINQFTPTDLEEHYGFLQRTKTPTYTGEEIPKYVIHHLGLKVGSVSAISKKTTIFLKYGATFSLPMNQFIKDDNVTMNSYESYQIGVANHDEFGLFDQLIKKEYANLYLGLGFMF